MGFPAGKGYLTVSGGKSFETLLGAPVAWPSLAVTVKRQEAQPDGRQGSRAAPGLGSAFPRPEDGGGKGGGHPHLPFAPSRRPLTAADGGLASCRRAGRLTPAGPQPSRLDSRLAPRRPPASLAPPDTAFGRLKLRGSRPSRFRPLPPAADHPTPPQPQPRPRARRGGSSQPGPAALPSVPRAGAGAPVRPLRKRKMA